MATATTTNDLDTGLAAIEAKRQKEAEALRAANTKAGDAQRKRIHKYVTTGKGDSAMADYYADAEYPRQELDADVKSCKAAIEREGLVTEAARAESDYHAALSRFEELQPLIEEARSDLVLTRRQHPNQPTEDDYRALRTAEGTLQELVDSEAVARETHKREAERMRALRDRADALGVRFDADSQLPEPMNFALRSTTAIVSPPSAKVAEKAARLAQVADEAREKAEGLDAEIVKVQAEHDRLMKDYEASKADENSLVLREIKFNLQSAEDKLRKLKEDHKTWSRKFTNTMDRFDQLSG